jgi:hypothetical protein
MVLAKHWNIVYLIQGRMNLSIVCLCITMFNLIREARVPTLLSFDPPFVLYFALLLKFRIIMQKNQN